MKSRRDSSILERAHDALYSWLLVALKYRQLFRVCPKDVWCCSDGTPREAACT